MPMMKPDLYFANPRPESPRKEKPRPVRLPGGCLLYRLPWLPPDVEEIGDPRAEARA